MKKLFKRLSTVTGVIVAMTFSLLGYLDATLPNEYYLSSDNGLAISCSVNVSCEENPENDSEVTLKLFGIIPIKDASIERTDSPTLLVGGTPIGIKMLTDGVVVVSTSEVTDGISPAEDAGIRSGDCIKKANGETITSATQFADIITASRGAPINLTVERDSKSLTLTLKAVYSQTDGEYKAGLLIRDSSAGIGTLTFIDPQTGQFGALGHPITDFDTKQVMPLASGEIVDVTVTSYQRGISGCCGELYGSFTSNIARGSITQNTDRGIFGQMYYQGGNYPAMPTAFKNEVKTGSATILTTIEGDTPKEYDIEIEKITLSTAAGTKNMVIKVTDQELLGKTGGIIQGMSGSPIIQDGKLVGAITHVFLSDPTRGYGIFIENMLEH